MAECGSIRVLVAERDALPAAALSALLAQCLRAAIPERAATVRQCAATAPATIAAQACRSRATVVVMRAVYLDPSRRALAAALRRAGASLVLLLDRSPARAGGAGGAESRWLADLVGEGVSLLSPTADAAEVAQAIRCASSGHTHLGAEVAVPLAHATCARGGANAGGHPLDTLSNRERAVMRLLSEGHDRKAISGLMALSPKTVSTYRCRIMRKLELRTDVQLARLWLTSAAGAG